MDLVIRPDALDSPIGQRLLAGFVEEIALRYPGWHPGIGPSADPSDFMSIHGRFLVALDHDMPVGCGGIKRLDEHTGEIKRLFVVATARGHGVGQRLLSALEETALEFGWTGIRLDTGDSQPEALGLFHSAGYRAIPDYNANRYASYWFEKSIR